MGAEGGVCWIPLRDPVRFDRVKDLIQPFYFLTKYGNADWQEDANDEYMDAHPYLYGENFLVGTYGSFQDFSLLSLENILSDEREICSDPSLTFLELMEDLDTRPLLFPERPHDEGPAQYGYLPTTRASISRLRGTQDAHQGIYLSTLEIMLWDRMRYSSVTAARCKELFPISDIKVSDWRDELNYLLNLFLVGCKETWT